MAASIQILPSASRRSAETELGRLPMPPYRQQFRGVHILHSDSRMRGGGPLRFQPGFRRTEMRAAISDNALLANAHFKAQRAGMRPLIKTCRWRVPDIHQQQGPVSGQSRSNPLCGADSSGFPRASDLDSTTSISHPFVFVAAIK